MRVHCVFFLKHDDYDDDDNDDEVAAACGLVVDLTVTENMDVGGNINETSGCF